MWVYVASMVVVVVVVILSEGTPRANVNTSIKITHMRICVMQLVCGVGNVWWAALLVSMVWECVCYSLSV